MRENQPRSTMLLVASFIGGAFMLSASFVFSAPAQNPQYSITLPAVSMDFSDLDVRDHNNKKLKSASQQAQIRQLFITRLNQMLMHNLTPGTKAARQMMTTTWDFVSGWLKRATGYVLFEDTGWLKEKKKDFKPSLLEFHRNPSLTHASLLLLFGFSRKSFQYLISQILSSTVLLR